MAVIPFRRGEEIASVCSDGRHHAAISNHQYHHHDNLWWACEDLQSKGFKLDWDQIKVYADCTFSVLCPYPRYAIKQLGVSWVVTDGGKCIASMPTKWQAQFKAVQYVMEQAF